MLDQMVQFILDKFSQMGYSGVTIMMTIESSFIPFPSEVVIPPAAYLASKGELNLYLVILSGIIGSILGALINYFLAFFLGRAVVYRLAETRFLKLCMINTHKIQRAEQYFNKYGILSTFIGRLIPVIRQLISIPAGLSKMNLGSFVLFTAIGSGIWTVILAMFGYYFGENQEFILENIKIISYGFLLIFIIGLSLYYLRYKKNKKSLYK
ncbi:MAG: DedA family protein [Candidatus Cloacimonetes bacterium]|nr:DedA family protein [Candidatus Cloacimonadota bacterium]